MGGYLQLITPGIPLLGAWIYSGPYAIPNYSFTCTGVFTNTTPTDAYRGAGRPEATYVIERTIDALAAELGMDVLELRRKNFITEFPAHLASGLTIDSGDYAGALDKLLERLGLDDLRAEQAARRERGDVKQLGVGFSTYTEMCGIAPSRILGAIRFGAGGWESATVRALPHRLAPGGDGHVAARPGSRDRLGADRRRPARLRHLGDRGAARRHGDRPATVSTRTGAVACRSAARRSSSRREKVIEKARQLVAHQMEVVRRRPRLRERAVLREGLARPGDAHQGGGLGRVRGAQPPGRDGAVPAGDGDLRRRRTSRGRAARTPRSSRSTPRPAMRVSSGTSPSTRSAPS